MKIELLIVLITGFFIVNSYSDNKYLNKIMSYRKYYEMASIALVGFSLYLMIKKNPIQSKSMLYQIQNIIKYMPVDKSAAALFTPSIFSSNDDMSNGENNGLLSSFVPSQQKRMMNSGSDTSKRCVSETKKKWIASQQNWHCGMCNNQLNAWFEVDHRIGLEHGGTNHVNNLIALCRECHGKKTMMNRL